MKIAFVGLLSLPIISFAQITHLQKIYSEHGLPQDNLQSLSQRQPNSSSDMEVTLLPKSSAPMEARTFTIQVASYPEKSQALLKLGELKAQGHDAYQSSAIINGKAWYRVNIGQFKGLKKTKAFRHKLIEKNLFSDSIIRQIR